MKVTGKHIEVDSSHVIIPGQVYEIHHRLAFIPAFASAFMTNLIVNWSSKFAKYEVIWWAWSEKEKTLKMQIVYPGPGGYHPDVEPAALAGGTLLTIGVIAGSISALLVAFGVSVSYMARIQPVTGDIKDSLSEIKYIAFAGLAGIGMYYYFQMQGRK